jgi:hypothetical protein
VDSELEAAYTQTMQKVAPAKAASLYRDWARALVPKASLALCKEVLDLALRSAPLDAEAVQDAVIAVLSRVDRDEVVAYFGCGAAEAVDAGDEDAKKKNKVRL